MERIEIEPNFDFYTTLNYALNLTNDFVEDARFAKSDIELEVSLKMASRSLCLALEIFGKYLADKKRRPS